MKKRLLCHVFNIEICNKTTSPPIGCAKACLYRLKRKDETNICRIAESLEYEIELADWAHRYRAVEVVPLKAIQRPVMHAAFTSAIGTKPTVRLPWNPVGVVEWNARSRVGHPSERAVAVVVNVSMSARDESVSIIHRKHAWCHV